MKRFQEKNKQSYAHLFESMFDNCQYGKTPQTSNATDTGHSCPNFHCYLGHSHYILRLTSPPTCKNCLRQEKKSSLPTFIFISSCDKPRNLYKK